MWDGNLIVLQDWSGFAAKLSSALTSIPHVGLVAVRNFTLLSCNFDDDCNILDTVDRLDLVRTTGTDRDDSSSMWNAPGHDFEHDITPSGKKPSEIIYAYVAETNGDNYLVHYKGDPEEFDLTESLSEQDGILIYDASKLKRVSKNEHWFLTDPREALLLVFTIEPDE